MKCVGVSARGKRSAGRLVQREGERAGQAGLQRVDAHLAVALHPVAVAGGEVGARHPDRQEQRRPGAQLLVVEVAAVLPRLLGGDGAVVRRRRHAHDAEERRQRQLGPPWQAAGAAARSIGDVADPALREILRQGAGQRAEAAIAPVGPELDRIDAHLERVAGLGPARLRPARSGCAGHARRVGAWIASSAGGNGEAAPAGGSISGVPDRHSSVTVSPESMVSDGGNAASNMPHRTVSGEAASVVAGHACTPDEPG